MSMLTMDGHLIDGYLDYRALSVNSSQGSGKTEYKYCPDAGAGHGRDVALLTFRVARPYRKPVCG